MNRIANKNRNMRVLEVVKAHRCEACSADNKRHLLGHWLEIINTALAKGKRISNGKCLSKIFKALKGHGIYAEKFLIGKHDFTVEDNYYVYLRKVR
jgi:hypothetical protein